MLKAFFLHAAALAIGWAAVALSGVPIPDQADAEGSRLPSSSPDRNEVPADVVRGKALVGRIARVYPPTEVNGPDEQDTVERRLALALEDMGFDAAGGIAPGSEEDWSDTDDATRRDLYDQMVMSIMHGALSYEGGRDLYHEFAVGKIEAGEIYELYATKLPGPASSGVLRSVIYLLLAPVDPVRAAGLLASIGEESSTNEKYTAARHRQSPGRFLSLMGTIPESKEDPRRRRAWEGVTPRFIEEYGVGYLRWLERQPVSLDRDWAAAALATRLAKSNAAESSRMEALIRSPEVRSHLSHGATR